MALLPLRYGSQDDDVDEPEADLVGAGGSFGADWLCGESELRSVVGTPAEDDVLLRMGGLGGAAADGGDDELARPRLPANDWEDDRKPGRVEEVETGPAAAAGGRLMPSRGGSSLSLDESQTSSSPQLGELVRPSERAESEAPKPPSEDRPLRDMGGGRLR